MPVRLPNSSLLAAIALAVLSPGPARADLEGCRSAIVLAGAAFAKSELAALARCEERIRAGGLAPQACRQEPDTQAALAKAAAKRERRIARACGGDDRACGGDLAGELGGAALGWPASCPLQTASCGTVAFDDCGGVDACLGCVMEDAVDRSLDLAYGALLPPGGDRALDRCQDAIAKSSAALHAARAKALSRCWQRVAKGAAVGPCPPHGSADAKTAGKLAAAEARARSAICKACGGGDRSCGGGDDLAPAAIGFAATCPDVTTPGEGLACGGPVDDLASLVDCLSCASAFGAYCADAATVPQELVYPSECSAACSPGFERACYGGPVGTEGVGLCHAGTETCGFEGTGFGPCGGEVTPSVELCTGGADEDCDGAADEGLGFSPDLASIASALVLALDRAGQIGFPASCGGTPAFCCPGGNPLADCGPSDLIPDSPAVVSPTATPNRFSFSVPMRIQTLEDLPIELPGVGSCFLEIDTSAGTVPYIEISGEVEFAGPDPGAAVVGGLDLTLANVEDDDFQLGGNIACPFGSVGLAAYQQLLEGWLDDALLTFHAEGGCQL